MTVEGSNTLADLASRINDEHGKVGEAFRQGYLHAAKAGDLLVEAKALLDHGEWLPWLAEHCRISRRTAQLYTRIARNREAIEANAQDIAHLTLDGAAQLIANRPGLVELVEDVEEAMESLDRILAWPSQVREFEKDWMIFLIFAGGLAVPRAELVGVRMRRLLRQRALIEQETDQPLRARFSDIYFHHQRIEPIFNRYLKRCRALYAILIKQRSICGE